MPPKTLYEKIWDSHVVYEEAGKPALIYIDRHLIHEGTSPQAFAGLKAEGRKVRRPDLTFAVMDHSVPTTRERSPISRSWIPTRGLQFEALEKNCRETGVRLFDMNSRNQGIVHIIGPELGVTQPGQTIVCGDSHTSTHGAFGTLAFGIGTSEVEHVLATQCLVQSRSKTLHILVHGKRPRGVTAKDIILAIIGKIGISGGTGHVAEYGGEAIRDLSMDGRMTVCNMTIEGGARAGMIAPDDTTFAYMEGRPFVPRGKALEDAVDRWKQLKSDDGARFDMTVELQAKDIAPQVTWGTNPGMVTSVTGRVPEPGSFHDLNDQKATESALKYMGLKAGTPIVDIPVDRVFIGSCTNSRLDDLRAAAHLVAGKHVAQQHQASADRARFARHQSASRKRRPRQNFPRRRFRVARRWLQHVHRHECRRPASARAQRQHQQSQFRRSPGQGQPNAPGQPGDGRGRGDCRPFCGCPLA